MTKFLLFFMQAWILYSCIGCNYKDTGSRKYYFDSLAGDDSNKGDSPEHAWKNLPRLTRQKIKAGDQILLAGGGAFSGWIRLAEISGTKDNPVIISSYGSGKAIIESADSAAIIARNCSYLIIRNLTASGSGRLKGNNANGIELIKCSFSKVDSVSANGYLYSGIRITGGNDITITHSRASDNGFCGINVDSGESGAGTDGSAYKTMRNLYIGYCVAENNPGCPAINNNHSGNGILVGGVTNGLIEYCEAMNNGWDMPREGNGPVGIWAWMSDSITIQHCYAHHNKTSPKGKDGGGFDFDGGIRHSIMQYNLSAFNEGAGYGIFQYAGASQWTNNIARFNISYNDGSKNGQCGMLVWSDPSAEPMTRFHAYNNTIVNNYGYGVAFEPGAYKDFLFENNIFEVTVRTNAFIYGKFTLAAFNNNSYWCDYNVSKGMPQPKQEYDKNGLVADPLLLLPENDTILLKNTLFPPELKYFGLHEGSSCKKGGIKIEGNGGYDFWKNPVNRETNPDIGAWQGK